MEALKTVFRWIQLNPRSFGGFLIAVLAIIFKGYLQITGKSEQLEAWNASAESYVDAITTLITTYGMLTGINHATRGSDLPPGKAQALIISTLQPTPVANAMQEVKDTTEEINEPTDAPPKPDTPESPK
jgi:hypothetical protein